MFRIEDTVRVVENNVLQCWLVASSSQFCAFLSSVVPGCFDAVGSCGWSGWRAGVGVVWREVEMNLFRGSYFLLGR